MALFVCDLFGQKIGMSRRRYILIAAAVRKDKSNGPYTLSNSIT